MIRIATPHPHGDTIKPEDVTVGRTSRIQDGYLVRIHANPKLKYEGVTVILGPCTLRRSSGGGTFELVGDRVTQFVSRFYTSVIEPILSKQHVPKVVVTHDALNGSPYLPVRHNPATRWYTVQRQLQSQQSQPSQCPKTYNSVTESYVDNHVYGMAAIMTRGPWFHASKLHSTIRWNLLEFVVLA